MGLCSQIEVFLSINAAFFFFFFFFFVKVGFIDWIGFRAVEQWKRQTNFKVLYLQQI